MKQHHNQEAYLPEIVQLIRQDRREEITPYICSPSSIERSGMIPPDDPLGKEALIISDAFESVTNGMHNPEAIDALQGIGDGSPFFGWKQAILAIQAFYHNQESEVKLFLEAIPHQSPAAAFIPVLRKACGDDIPLSRAEQELYNGITEDRSFIASAQVQLKESLDADMEELFLETTLLLLQDIKAEYPEAALKLAVWGMKTASLYGFSADLLIGKLKQLYGAAESYRLCALALAEEETEISLLFWIRSLLARLGRGDITDREIEAYLDIIASSAGQVQELTGDIQQGSALGYEQEEWETYLSSLSALLTHLGDNLSGRGTFSLPVSGQDDGTTLFARLSSLGDETGSGKEGPIRPERTERTRRVERTRGDKPKMERPVQLELFI